MDDYFDSEKASKDFMIEREGIIPEKGAAFGILKGIEINKDVAEDE